MKKLTVYTNKLVTLGNTYVGRIDKDSYATSTNPTTFYTGEIGNYNVPHVITAPLYIGGPAVSAPTDDQSNKALSIANKLAAKLTKEQIELVKSKLEVKTLQ